MTIILETGRPPPPLKKKMIKPLFLEATPLPPNNRKSLNSPPAPSHPRYLFQYYSTKRSFHLNSLMAFTSVLPLLFMLFHIFRIIINMTDTHISVFIIIVCCYLPLIIVLITKRKIIIAITIVIYKNGCDSIFVLTSFYQLCIALFINTPLVVS